MQIKINEITKKSNRESCYNMQNQCFANHVQQTLYTAGYAKLQIFLLLF